MGSGFYVYVGPMVKCVPSQVERIKSMNTCSNAGCSKHAQGITTPFCSLCGSAQVKLEVVEKVDMNGWDAVAAVDEALYMMGAEERFENHIFAGNVKRPGEPDREMSFSSYTGAGVISNIDSAAELRWFEEAFAPEIETLRSLYGTDNVSLHWGVCHYFS